MTTRTPDEFRKSFALKEYLYLQFENHPDFDLIYRELSAQMTAYSGLDDDADLDDKSAQAGPELSCKAWTDVTSHYSMG